MKISKEELKPYRRLTDAQQNIRSASDFTDQVMDYYMSGERLTGIKLPFRYFDNKFRLRPEEMTVLAGINGAGKSLLASQIMLSAMEQGNKCLSISLEMSPKAQLARMWRQASLQVEPTLDSGLEFTRWSNKKLFLYDQHGSIDYNTLISVIRYSVDNLGINLVLVDSLMTMSMASDDWNGQKAVVCALANCARNLGIHVILVAHARKGQSISDRLDKWSVAGSADITNRTDNVILFGRTYEEDSTKPDAYFSLCKARNFDGAEGDLDLNLCMASLNYYTNDDLPHPIGVEEQPPKGGVMGELHKVALYEPPKRKSKRQTTTTVVQAVAS